MDYRAVLIAIIFLSAMDYANKRHGGLPCGKPSEAGSVSTSMVLARHEVPSGPGIIAVTPRINSAIHLIKSIPYPATKTSPTSQSWVPY